MRISTRGLTGRLQLLKYVASDYWNMYVTSVPRNSFTPHAACKHQHWQVERADYAMASNCQGSVATPGAHTRLNPPPKHTHTHTVCPSAWKDWNYEIWIGLGCGSSAGVLSVRWAGPLIDLSLPLGGCLTARVAAQKPKAPPPKKKNSAGMLGNGLKNSRRAIFQETDGAKVIRRL